MPTVQNAQHNHPSDNVQTAGFQTFAKSPAALNKTCLTPKDPKTGSLSAPAGGRTAMTKQPHPLTSAPPTKTPNLTKVEELRHVKKLAKRAESKDKKSSTKVTANDTHMTLTAGAELPFQTDGNAIDHIGAGQKQCVNAIDTPEIEVQGVEETKEQAVSSQLTARSRSHDR